MRAKNVYFIFPKIMARYQESMRRRMWTIRKKKFRLPPNWRSSCSIPPPLIITILGKTNFPSKMKEQIIFAKLFGKMKFHKIWKNLSPTSCSGGRPPSGTPSRSDQQGPPCCIWQKKIFFSNNWLRETAVSSKRVLKAHYYYLFHFSGICAMLSILSLLASMMPLGYKSISHVLIINIKFGRNSNYLNSPAQVARYAALWVVAHPGLALLSGVVVIQTQLKGNTSKLGGGKFTFYLPDVRIRAPPARPPRWPKGRPQRASCSRRPFWETWILF